MTLRPSTKKILIATGIYPPAIGGPAEYAKNLEDVWNGEGHTVTVKYFDFEHKLPSGVRHIYFFLKSFGAVWKSDFILVLDTFSVALPIALAAFILRKDFVVRAGGDFLWESYVERTKEKILFKNFYKEERDFTTKEKFIIKSTNWILKRASRVIFSTAWQRDIWSAFYKLDLNKVDIIENFYDEHKNDFKFEKKVFLGSTRKLVWKNLDTLANAFLNPKVKAEKVFLVTAQFKRPLFIEAMEESYAVILVSLGDISPNMILDAIRCNKPFIVTREIGIYPRIKDIGLYVDPLDEEDIAKKIVWLCNPENYQSEKNKIANFKFTHSWKEIAREILNS